MTNARLRIDRRWIAPYLALYRPQLLRALGMGVLAFACSSLMMFAAGYLISWTATLPGSIFVSVLPLVAVEVFGLGKPIVHYLERLANHDWVFRMTSDLRRRLYRVLAARAASPAAPLSAGDALGYIAEDIGHLQNLFLRVIFPTVVAWILALAVAAFCGLFSPWLAGIMLLTFGVTGVALPYLSLLVNRAREAERKAKTDELYAVLTDDVLGAADWMMAGRAEVCIDRFEEAQRRQAELAHALDVRDRRFALALKAVFAAGAVGTIAWAAGYFGAQGGAALNFVAAFVLGFFPLTEAFAPLSQAAKQATAFAQSIERLDDLDEAGAEDAEGARDARPQGSEIRLDLVAFAYPASPRPVIDGVSLAVAPGEHVAVLGRSGSGKSTLLALIHGDAAPTRGSATVGGAPAARLAEPAATFSLMQQQPYLFNRSLRENLALGAPKAADEEIWGALAAVGLADLARSLPHGLDTIVDEGGRRFSGGQRHRIALARVLLASAPVVLLDEPTIALDPVTEADLLDTLFRVLSDRTIVMVTHHLQGIEHFDRVIFLEDGRIELDGSPARLARESERFRTLLAFDRGDGRLQ
jgi:ATP-binding cassette subfamily C protein CydC